MRGRVSDEMFVREYMKGGSQAEIAARLGLDQSSVSLRAKNMRLRGVRLPSFHLSVDELNAIVDECAERGGE